MLRDQSNQSACYLCNLIPAETSWDENNARVRHVGGYGSLGNQHEIPNIARYDRPIVPSRVLKLRLVGQLAITSLMGADCVNTLCSKNLRDPRGEVLVQIERHSTCATRTSAGYSRSIAPGVSEAFSSISCRISSE